MLNRMIPKLKNDVSYLSTASGQSAPVESAVFTNEQAKPEMVPGMIAVLGAKGGVGASSIALNLAAAFAMKAPTVIVDANFQQPEIAHMFAVEPVHSVMELLARTSDLDRQLFEACCFNVSHGEAKLDLLSPPLDGQAALKANLTVLSDCLLQMHQYRSSWIVDMPRHLDRHFVTMADICEKVLLVFEANVTGIATAQRWLSIFRELGYASDRIICVLNRSGSKYSGIERQLNSCFPDREIVRIPNASSMMWALTTQGLPALISAPNHAYSKAMIKLRDRIVSSSSKR